MVFLQCSIAGYNGDNSNPEIKNIAINKNNTLFNFNIYTSKKIKIELKDFI